MKVKELIFLVEGRYPRVVIMQKLSDNAFLSRVILSRS